jgi:hypothetical protein
VRRRAYNNVQWYKAHLVAHRYNILKKNPSVDFDEIPFSNLPMFIERENTNPSTMKEEEYPLLYLYSQLICLSFFSLSKAAIAATAATIYQLTLSFYFLTSSLQALNLLFLFGHIYSIQLVTITSLRQ